MRKNILLLTSLCVASTSALAGGYRVAIQGQKALGMGHTGVAMSESSEVVFFNPAGMPFLSNETELTAGLTLLEGETRYQNQTTGASAKTNNRTGTPINVYLASKQDDKISTGIGVYTPYGNNVEWPTDWAGSHLVNNIDLKTVFIQPTIAYRINEQSSFGFGPVLVNGEVTFNRNLSSSLANANGRSNVTLKETSVMAWGYNIGYMTKPADGLTLGVSYRSQVDMDARGGDATFQNIPASFAGTFPPADQRFNADLILPAELTIGLSYQLSPDTVIAFDINRTDWSEYKSLDINFLNPATPDSINPRNYEDANIYRIGVQHRLNDTLTLRGGIYFDESPIPDGRFTPETARNDAVSFTGGASYKMTSNLELDFSVLIVTFDEFNGAYTPPDPAQNFSGQYKSAAHSVGFGINYVF
jgi:long-chain fatty acid transport protein